VRRRAGALPSAVLLSAAVLACAREGPSKQVEEIGTTVLTLQTGTVHALRERRGTGPTTRYEVGPERLVGVVARAARRLADPAGRSVVEAYPSPRSLEVVAKERDPADLSRDGYDVPWRSAMVAIVHRIPGEDDAALLEVHASDRGPLRRGRVAWGRDLPRAIDAVLAEDRAHD